MPFIVTAAGSNGLSYKQTRAAYLRTPTRGVRALITETSWLDHVEALALVLPAGTVFSHTTAARLHGLPLPTSEPRPFHVTSDASGVRGRRKGVAWHRASLSGVVEQRHGLAVTTPLRTLCDVASLLDLEELVVIADVLLRRDLCTRQDLAAVRGVRHARVLRQVAELADGASLSPRETTLRLAFRRAGLPIPEVNADIVDNGIWIGQGDWVWRAYRVIADYDGEHHDRPEQRHQDAQTRDDYAAHGWRHLVLTKKMSAPAAVARVERALLERGWPG